jgi:hypothetical protein
MKQDDLGRINLATANNSYKKLAVQWLNEALLINNYFLKAFVSPSGVCFVSSLVLAYSFTHTIIDI